MCSFSLVSLSTSIRNVSNSIASFCSLVKPGSVGNGRIGIAITSGNIVGVQQLFSVKKSIAVNFRILYSLV